MHLKNIEEAIKKCRSKDTCYPNISPDRTPENPSLWQCLVTTLVVQDLLWWEIYKSEEMNHYRNVIDNNIVDLTHNQFVGGISYQDWIPINRDNILYSHLPSILAKTNERYLLLKELVMKLLYAQEATKTSNS